MSAGAFIITKYQSDTNGIYRCRVQPETLQLEVDGVANAAPLGDVDQFVSAQVSKGKRQIGMGCRAIAIRFTGTVPTGYKVGGVILVPILTSALFNAVLPTSDITYLTLPAEVVYIRPESRK